MTDDHAEMDREATQFAMELLMPFEFLGPEIAKLKCFDIEDDAQLSKLAKKFGVSAQIMAIRVGQFMERANV